MEGDYTNYGSMSLAQSSVNLQSPTPQRPRPARVPALSNARPHTGPEVGSARELLRPSIHLSYVARSLGDCMDLHSRTWDQTRRFGSDRTALVCARLRHQRSQQHQFLAGSVASFDIILVPEPTWPAGDGVPGLPQCFQLPPFPVRAQLRRQHRPFNAGIPHVMQITSNRDSSR